MIRQILDLYEPEHWTLIVTLLIIGLVFIHTMTGANYPNGYHGYHGYQCNTSKPAGGAE